ncbi:unnamed protein product [Linum trigynum]|uniref:Uncharacterized protein n=1 Tax=Linum trigynum TaxID=586398 RepID=A0AAV2FUH5_9ROSI
MYRLQTYTREQGPSKSHVTGILSMKTDQNPHHQPQGSSGRADPWPSTATDQPQLCRPCSRRKASHECCK